MNKTNISNAENGSRTTIATKLLATLIALVFIALTVFFATSVIPNNILANTDEVVAERKKQSDANASNSTAASIKSRLEDENGRLKFTNQVALMNIENYGELKIELKDTAAPKTVENFIRLSSRGYYNNLVFHRMVKGESFNIIQGGDPQGDGKGGETANNEPLEDEVWNVKPEYKIDENDPERKSVLVNTPTFTDPSLYPGYTQTTGQVFFPRGLILMANSGSPNSGESQFFITLDLTLLPASYTVFGTLNDLNTLETLNRIKDEVNPIVTSPSDTQTPTDSAAPKDGKPDKNLKIVEVKIVDK